MANSALRNRRHHRLLPVVIVVLIASAFASLTWLRNRIWGSPVALWTDTVAKSPGKYRPRFQFAYAQYQAGNCAQATKQYGIAANLGPRDYRILLDWALAEDCAGRPDAAISRLQEAAGLQPTALVYSQIGLILAKQGKSFDALPFFRKAEAAEPGFEMTYVYRGFLYARSGYLPRAIGDLKTALALNPRDETAASALRMIERSRRTASRLGPRTSEVGIFRGNFEWILDANGNRQFDGASQDQDYVYFNFIPSEPGDIPVVGDWNGSGTTKIGVYRPSTGQWFLDYNGNGTFDPGDRTYRFGGIRGDRPVVGDWSGSGTSKIGIFRSGYFWILDYNGDGSFDAGDQAFAFGGVAGDLPVTGDWTGDGKDKVGLVRPFFPRGTPALWILDANNDHAIDSGDLVFSFGGATGDVPVVGDWNGTGFAKAGVYRHGFFWVIDTSGNAPLAFGGSESTGFAFGGVAGDIPVVGRW